MSKKILFLSVALIIGVSFFVGAKFGAISDVFADTSATSTSPSINVVSPASGPTNTFVTMSGSNFTPTGNQINFFCPAISSGGGEASVSSADGKSLVTRVTSLAVQAGTTISYPLSCTVSVTNVNGTSNLVPFIITSSATQPSITILSPNGGEIWQAGKTGRVKFSSQNLVGYTLGEAVINQATFKQYPIAYGVKIKQNGNDDDVFVIPSTIPAGSYKLLLDASLTAPCSGDLCNTSTFEDQSDAPFTITSGTSNGSPKITGFPAIPANIQPGQTVSISLSATDPDNDDLSWSVSWGEGIGQVSSCSSVRRQTGTGWNFSANYAWALAGIYQVNVTVNDCVGGSDSYSFSVTVGNSANRPPVINGATAPTMLSLNQTGTWIVRASDPENGPLSYSVDWGDVSSSPTSGSAAASLPFVQTSTFTHSYSSTGTYTVVFTVRDNGGLTAQTSSTVQVGNVTTPSITVLSPNGGETYKVGESITISWFSVGVDRFSVDYCVSDYCERIATNITGSSYRWAIPSNINNRVPGNYKITVSKHALTVDSTFASDTSDSYFTITSPINRPPAINGVSAPTTLNVNQTGTWTVKASDPENGQLSYSVDWGDANEKQLDSASALNSFIQTSTFTHSYAQAGTYTSIFTVKDSAGLTAQTSATVRVEDNSTPTNSCSVAPLAAMDSSLSPKLFNIDFGKWLPGASDKTGSAIVGNKGDYWNVLGVPWCDDHNKSNLKNADQSSSSIIVEMKNLGGSWGDGGNLLGLYDPMLKDFSYPANNKGGNAYVIMSNVPAGSYDLYLYNKTSNDSQNGDYAVTVGGRDYGRKLMTTDVGSYKANSWQENNQFVIFKIAVNSGESVKILIQPSVGGFQDAQIAGLQLAPAGTPPATAYAQYSSDIVSVKPRLVTVSEQVKCVFKFKGFASEQKCYTATDDSSSYRNYGCSGTGSCLVDMKGMNGDKITWKSSCGGYGYSVMDGANENVTFYCADPATVEEKKTDEQILDIKEKSKLIFNNNNFDFILAELNQLRSIIKEQQTEIKYLKSLIKDVKALSEKSQEAINKFITYGVDANTEKLGAGERAAVMNSYKAAFDKLPETEAELADAIKIANGRFPSVTSDEAEKTAKEQFVKIYKRTSDLNNANDNAAIKVMAYGLRQKAENRNLNSEKAGIKIFKDIFGDVPKTTEDWNTMQAITYSGASR